MEHFENYNQNYSLASEAVLKQNLRRSQPVTNLGQVSQEFGKRIETREKLEKEEERK